MAVLDSGFRLSYKEYVGGHGMRAHPHWSRVRENRYNFDGGMCVVCKAKLDSNNYQAHHLTYDRLGHERTRDVITLCDTCHENFHSKWKYAEYYKEQDDNHWEMFSISNTAQLCGEHLGDDYWFGGDLDCCNIDTCRDLIDLYFEENEIIVPVSINPEDVQLYFRNKRYEALFTAENKGLLLTGSANESVEKFLDVRFGAKGGKGGNPQRSKARGFMLRHNSESYHRNYWYLKHINELMKEAKKYE